MPGFGLRKTLVGLAEGIVHQDLDGDGRIADGLTREEIIHRAFREALREAVEKAVENGSRDRGFLDDTEIHIPFPEEVHHVRSALRKIGQEEKAEEVEETLNRAAEQAAGGALTVFIDAVCSLTLQSAGQLIRGDNPEGCTEYLREQCSDSLTAVFAPVVDDCLDRCRVVHKWDRVIEVYNKIPLVPDISFDVRSYCVGRAVHGLLRLMARQERSIRADPSQAVSSYVQTVFSRDFWQGDEC
eukprot:TRINITY_DN22914_c0_g1_i1.p2 TRINITY_DN22914_c0_g1~~TRINITY_DN22914_c0_g1_i1.p2  ORF type:complete len:265 (+),score=104.09 TRINITY_DN22914_c0_g1_i1:70-795(+)